MVAVLVIGPYLLLEIVILSVVAVMVWRTPNIFVPFVGDPGMNALKGLVLSAAAAGIGGSVFMVREFYLNVAYGPPYGDREYLRNAEIPRYVLLPFSSVVLGAIGYCLLLAGLIVPSGLSVESGVPLYSAAVVGFLLGFAYHDTLNKLRQLSRRLFDSSDEQERLLAQLRLLKNALSEGLMTDEQYQTKREEILKKI